MKHIHNITTLLLTMTLALLLSACGGQSTQDKSNTTGIQNPTTQTTGNTSNNTGGTMQNGGMLGGTTVVDTTAPVITLNGGANITLEQNTVYTELGATAVDDRDGNVSVEINGTVDTSIVGTYTITYVAKDRAGNSTTVTRTVDVEESVNPEIKKLEDILNDPSIPYTTDADFNKTEYAKHHLPDDEARKLERAHYLVATAIDPDPTWFYTKVDTPVIMAKQGEDYTVHLHKMRKDGKVYAPVDNDKLRLVVRIQRTKDDFEYVTNVNIEQYAHWDGAGVLKIHVPDDLDKGRLIVGVRPNFTDVATSAIAERWSAVITAEVLPLKAGVKEVNSDNALFPIDNPMLNYLSAESKFTRSEIFAKVNEQMTNNQLFTFPVVVKNMSLKKDDMVSYIFKNSPRSGRVIAVEHRDNQDFVLLTPELLDVYDIIDTNRSTMIKEGIVPENIIIREGGRLVTDQNESDPTKFESKMVQKKGLGEAVDFFKKNCSEGEGDALLTFKVTTSLSPLDLGVDVGMMGTQNETKCTFEATSNKITIHPSYYAFPVSWALRAIGAKVEFELYGKAEMVTKEALGFGFDAGYTIRKGGHFKTLSVMDIGSRKLDIEAKKGTGEVSVNTGIKMTIVGVSLPEFAVNTFDSELGLTVEVGHKLAMLVTAKNAKEVEKSSSSEYATGASVDGKVELTAGLKNIFKYFHIDIKAERPFNIPLMDPIKGKAKFSFNSVHDEANGKAQIVGLYASEAWMNRFLPSHYEGVLALKDSSVYNQHSEDITYDLAECAKSPDYKITSPAIACAGWMCGVVDREVVLCKGKLSISEIVAEAKVGELASTGAVIVNKAGDIDVTVSGSPLEPQTTSLHMTADDFEYVVFEKMCASPGVKRGTSRVTAEGTNLSAEASNTLLCHDDDTHGDPHIVTGDKLGYDYYASGDYILSRIKDITGYEIQARFLPGYKTSWPQAVALQVGNDIVEIQGVKRDGHGNGTGVHINALAIWVNGKKGILGNDGRYSSCYDEDSINKNIAKLPSGGILAVTHTDSSNVLRFASDLTIIWPEGSPAQNYGVVLSVAKSGDPFVHIQIARPDDFAGQERGLMGNNDGNPKNDFIRRNGEVLGVDHNISFTELYALFGADWLVRPYESLFRNPEAIKPQFPTDVVTLTPEQRALGEQACAALTGFYREACIIDVGLTGNAELVKEYYANTEDLNDLSDAIVTPDVDQARYSMSVADKAYEADSDYYLHYTQNINVLQEAGEGKFMLLVRPPRGATALLDGGDTSLTAEGNYTTHIEVDCTELNSATNQAYLQSVGSVQLWLQDPLSGTASKMLSEAPLPCTDASKRAGYSLKRGLRTELADSNDTNLHYTQPLGIVHTNSYTGEYILEITPPTGAVVKLNGSSTELNITGNAERNDTLELDCSMADANATNGSVKLWEKDMLSGNKAYNYANYTLPCHKSKVLKTGQTTSYADFDDGDYQVGETRSYTRDDSKEIVTDNVTGLQWQDNSETKTIAKPWITQANYSAGKYDDTSGDTAATYCANLTLGGYNDWRLPTRKELISIVDYGRDTPSLDPEFLNVASHAYWSSTTYAGGSRNAWLVFFYGGYQDYYGKSASFYVRCVRAGQ